MREGPHEPAGQVPGWGPWGGELTGNPRPSGETEEEVENPETADLPEKLKHQLRHRELFLSRQLESLPATHIRYPAARRVPGVHPAPLTPALLLQREMQRHPAQRDGVAQVLPGAGGEADRPRPLPARSHPAGAQPGVCAPAGHPLTPSLGRAGAKAARPQKGS